MRAYFCHCAIPIEFYSTCTMNCHDPSGADRTVRQGPPKCGILADMQKGSGRHRWRTVWSLYGQ